ncbi:MAG: 1-acyl-sn-glycerol-3-phosphate acyltransferase, partial [Longimicrobiales bacterium]|nr:1-acyl-sn-glycerol-3-phosphate acyltransferase [Longimicrobiales bacterium]
HPNALIDPLVIFHTGGRTTRPLAKAPLFEQVFVGTVLKGLGGLPVYRRQDDPELMHLNDRTFDAAIEALHAGEAVQIYPEGQSHSEPALARIRTGAARIALMAEDRADWALGLQIQPVGLTYARKHLFRGRAVAAFGKPLRVADFREVYREDPREAARVLTEVIRSRLEELTLNFDHAEDQELVDVAERLWARDKGLASSRERAAMAERLPRLQNFAKGLRWLREVDPEELARLRHDTARYLGLIKLLGVREGDIPERFRAWPVARYALVQLTMLLFVFPVAVVGAVYWALPYFTTRALVPRFNPKLDQVATYKLSLAILLFPAWLLVTVVMLWLLVSWQLGLAALLALPVAGMAAVAWRDRRNRVLEDARVFLRVRKRADAHQRVQELRARLVESLDDVARRWQQEMLGRTK